MPLDRSWLSRLPSGTVVTFSETVRIGPETVCESETVVDYSGIDFKKHFETHGHYPGYGPAASKA